MNDLLLLVLVASAATNSLAGENKSLVNGMIIVATVIFWSYLFNWIGYKFPRLQRLFQPSPKVIIKDCQIQEDIIQKELITEEELRGKLRRRGTSDISKVREAYIESNGQISVLEH